MNELDINFYLEQYKDHLSTTSKSEWAYFNNEALQQHIYALLNALVDAQQTAIMSSRLLKQKEAQWFGVYGIARRWAHVWTSFREITQRVYLGREDPLPMDDVKIVSRDLNVIYINILGIIDNSAWCVRHERGSDKVKSLKENKVGLFVSEFIKDNSLHNLRSSIEKYNDWFSELRSRRDPAAHKIPLSVPPAALNPKAQERYAAIEAEISEAWRQRDLKKIETLMGEQQKLGRFVSLFLHHPSESPVPFYPTIPQDVGNTINIVNSVWDFLRE